MKRKRIKGSSKRRIALSLILPLYNESERLYTGLPHILRYVSRQPYRSEVILVDDGSDNNIKYQISKMGNSSLQVIRLERNYGKGRAIAQGVKAARGRYIIFSDIDLSVPIATVRELLDKLKKYPVVIASRRTPDATIVHHQSGLREGSGRLFTLLSNMLCGTHVADVTCGMKGYQAAVAKELFGLSHIDRWVFDTEILFLARKRGYRVYQLGVAWSHKAGSKVRALDGLTSLVDLLRIRWFDWQGVYNKQ